MKNTQLIGASNNEIKSLVEQDKTPSEQFIQYRHIRSLSNDMTKRYLRGRLIHVSASNYWDTLNSKQFEKPVIKNGRVVRGEDGKIVRRERFLTQSEILKMVSRYGLTLPRALRRKLGIGQPGRTYKQPIMVNHPE